jgi:hypothetical protein
LTDNNAIEPFRSVQADLEPGQQLNFSVKPTATRRYTFQTLGLSDTVLVLFEEIGGTPRYLAGDDDSGQDWNAKIEAKLYAGRSYVLRVRLYWVHRRGDFAVMMS